MFDFWIFYKGLLSRTDYFDDYWQSFPKGRLLRFKNETLSLLQADYQNKDAVRLPATLAVIYKDGADRDYTDTLLLLLNEIWHTLEEDLVGILELIKDPRSIEKLYSVAVHVPDYDEMRALAKKCMWVLSAIKTSEAIQKLEMLQESDDPIIKENALFQLDNLARKI